MKKKKVLIGSITENKYSPITTITKTIISSSVLSKQYSFVPHKSLRKHGRSKLAKFTLVNMYYFFAHFIKWGYELITFRPDIVHYPLTSYWNSEKSIAFLSVAGWFGSKKIAHLHGGAYLEFWKSIPKWRHRLNRRHLNKLDALIVASRFWKEGLRNECNLTMPIFVIPNPISSQFSHGIREYSYTTDSNSILFIGRLDEEKGIFDLVRAFGMIKNSNDCDLILAGQIFKQNALEDILQLIENYGCSNRVRIYSDFTEEEKIEYFKQCTIFVLPSHHENFPLVSIEAAAAGVPMILTPVGALPEYFLEEAAVFVEPNNPAELADTIVNLLRDTERRLELARNARKVFTSKLSRERIIHKLDEVYQFVCR